jgi:hypothetical protein
MEIRHIPILKMKNFWTLQKTWAQNPPKYLDEGQVQKNYLALKLWEWGRNKKYKMTFEQTMERESQKPTRCPLTSRTPLGGTHPCQGHLGKMKKQKKRNQMECQKP